MASAHGLRYLPFGLPYGFLDEEKRTVLIPPPPEPQPEETCCPAGTGGRRQDARHPCLAAGGPTCQRPYDRPGKDGKASTECKERGRRGLV